MDTYKAAYFIVNVPVSGIVIQFGHITDIYANGLKRLVYTDRDCRSFVAHTPLTFTTWLDARNYLIATGQYEPVPAY